MKKNDASIKYEDPRLFSPQCEELTPVETVHENPWFSVRNRGGYYTIEYRQSQVIVLPIVDDESVVMVRVTRPVIADSPLELPAGNSKAHESPVEAAAREFAEETGIRIDDLTRFEVVPPLSNSPNRHPMLLHIYQILITKKEFELRQSHDHEIEEVLCCRFEDVCEMILTGEIYISVPVALIGRYFMSHFTRCV
ncbi:MAG: NUDIX domain-containing protein [Methanosarcinaceae archaeon]